MRKTVTLSLGEVLWDVLPGGRTLGGAPANVARHLAQLGCEAHIVSAVGDDGLGREALAILGGFGLHTDLIAVSLDKPTGTVDAALDADGNASYDFHDDVAWDCIPVMPEALELAGRAAALNFGSLSRRTEKAREAQERLIRATPPSCIRVFDVNLREPYVFRNVLEGGFRLATVIKMNGEELGVISGMFGLPDNPDAAMAGFFEMWPNVRHVVVTRAEDGVAWHDGGSLVSAKAAFTGEIADTVGAGDSITAMIMHGLVNRLDAPRIARLAVDIASYVCTQRGGMPAFPEELVRRCTEFGA